MEVDVENVNNILTEMVDISGNYSIQSIFKEESCSIIINNNSTVCDILIYINPLINAKTNQKSKTKTSQNYKSLPLIDLLPLHAS